VARATVHSRDNKLLRPNGHCVPRSGLHVSLHARTHALRTFTFLRRNRSRGNVWHSSNNKTATVRTKAVTTASSLLLPVREAPGSNLGPATAYPNRGFRGFTQPLHGSTDTVAYLKSGQGYVLQEQPYYRPKLQACGPNPSILNSRYETKKK
jgi:hypothetical protein